MVPAERNYFTHVLPPNVDWTRPSVTPLLGQLLLSAGVSPIALYKVNNEHIRSLPEFLHILSITYGLSLEKAEALQYANGYYPDFPRRRMFCYLVLRQFEMEDEEDERGLWERFWTRAGETADYIMSNASGRDEIMQEHSRKKEDY